MALSDCEKCWETPCACGHDYKAWSTSKLQNLYNVIDKELKSRAKKLEEMVVKDAVQDQKSGR